MQSLIGTVLERYLGDYFENFSSDKFSMNLMKGEISLENLILKNTFNDRMNFPFKLKYGQLGKLVITTQSLI